MRPLLLRPVWAALLLVALGACDGPLPGPATSGQGLTPLWSRTFPATYAGERSGSLGTLAHPAGGLVAFGVVVRPFQLGAHRVEPAEEGSAYVARLDAQGEAVWARRLGGPHGSSPTAVALDAAGDVWVLVTEWTGLPAPEGASSMQASRALLVRVGPDGAVRGEWRYGAEASVTEGGALATGPGRITLTLRALEAIDVGTGPLAAVGSQDVVVVELDANGATRSAHRIGTPHYLTVGVEEAGEGARVYWGSVLEGAVAFATRPGGPVLGVQGSFVVREDAAGQLALLAAFAFPRTSAMSGLSLRSAEVDAQGNTHLLGWVHGPTDLGFGTVRNTSVVLKLDAQGRRLWARELDHAEGKALALGPGGRVLVTGSFVEEAALGGAPLVSAGAEDIFVVVLGPDGGTLASRSFGTPVRLELGSAACLDAQGVAYVSGSFPRTMDFGTGLHETTPGTHTLYLVALQP